MAEFKPQHTKQVAIQAKLAVERTVMANDRTLLSFIRTSLYFVVAGLTLNQLVSLSFGNAIAVAALSIGALLFFIGLFKYAGQLKYIRQSRKAIEQDIMG